MGQIPPNDINSILYYVNKNNPMGPAPTNPSDDPQYPLWQIGINNYLIRTGQYQGIQQTPPESTDPVN
jgi:hypothetical protein